MYLRKSTRRRIIHIGFLVTALIVLTPRLDLTLAPQLTAWLNATGLAQPETILGS